jgi:hypothetical protein
VGVGGKPHRFLLGRRLVKDNCLLRLRLLQLLRCLSIAGSVLDLIEAAPAVARLGRCCLSSPRYTSQHQCPASKKINLDKVRAIERLQLLRSALRRPVKSVCRSACVGLPRYSQASQETLSPLRDRTAFPTISRFLLAHIAVSVPHGRVGQK